MNSKGVNFWFILPSVVSLKVYYCFFLVSTDGKVKHNEVKALLKLQFTMTTVYKSITTSHNNVISLTEDHLIYARKNSTDKFNMM